MVRENRRPDGTAARGPGEEEGGKRAGPLKNTGWSVKNLAVQRKGGGGTSRDVPDISPDKRKKRENIVSAEKGSPPKTTSGPHGGGGELLEKKEQRKDGCIRMPRTVKRPRGI